MNDIRINIFEQIGGSAAVSTEDGESLYKRIVKALEQKARVILDFNNIELLTSTFLNSAIGQLYSRFKSPYLKAHLKLENLKKEDLELLKKVVERAKEYFKDKGRIVNGAKEVLG